MAWIITIRPIAYVDLDNIIAWYNLERENLGQQFLIEFNKYVEKVQENPYAYFTIFGPVRRLGLKKFLYKILFTINHGEAEITILGIVHYKRSNGYLKKRYA